MAHNDNIETILPVLTRSARETVVLGEQIGHKLRPGDVVALFGDLGAGKTQLAKGICRAHGIAEHRVSSPTFTLVQEYLDGSTPIYHFDAYRIESLNEMYDLGYDTYFFGDGITLVEWADRVESLIPADAVRIALRHAGDEQREITLVSDP